MAATLSNEQIRYAGRKILMYEPRPAADAFHRSLAKNRWLFGGNRCLGGEQEIYDPVACVSRRVQDIKGDFHVWAWDGGKLVIARARQPFTKPAQWLYAVRLANGQSVVCSGTHLLLTPGGYRPLAELSVGCVLFRPQTSAGISRCAFDEGVLLPQSIGGFARPDKHSCALGGSCRNSIAITAVEVKHQDVVWDFEVPDYHNYLAGGVIHHNSGKSEANIGFDLCSFALGIHPYRRTPKNATIWAAANAWELVGKLLWSEKIRAYLPMGQVASIVWHNKGADIPKEIRLRNGNVIELKAYEQGRKAFEGRAIDAFYGDEQCKDESEGIWQEIQARLLDRGGFSAQSMTPILHQGWLEERIRNLPETDSVHYADLNDNRRSRGGYVEDAEIDGMIAEWPPELQETRIRGFFQAFRGMVFPGFNREIHVCESFTIPDNWQRWRSIDFGFNNPFACLWLARDPDRRWYVYAEHYQARESLAYHAERIKAISRRERYRVTWADHDSQDRYELEKYGIKTLAARKDVHQGIESVQRVLKVQGDGKPRLQIFPTCKNLISELAGYRWAEGTEHRDARDEPVKVNDHACLTGDTLVLMADGTEKPIAAVRAGDRVCTTKGAQPVIAAALTGFRPVYRLILSNGRELRATADHEVFTPSGKVAVGVLRPGDEVLTRRQSFSGDRGIIGTDITTRLWAAARTAARGFTLRYGSIMTALFPKVATFTISTGTAPTIASRTCNVYRDRSTCADTASHLTSNRSAVAPSTCARFAPWRPFGTERQKADNGTAPMPGTSGTSASPASVHACTALRTIRPRTPSGSSVPTNAGQPHGGKPAKTLRSAFAVFVARFFKPTVTTKPARARVIAVESCAGRSAVYDISVAHDHQFYANGILVSNCDALRYAILGVEGNFFFSESDLS